MKLSKTMYPLALSLFCQLSIWSAYKVNTNEHKDACDYFQSSKVITTKGNGNSSCKNRLRVNVDTYYAGA